MKRNGRAISFISMAVVLTCLCTYLFLRSKQDTTWSLDAKSFDEKAQSLDISIRNEGPNFGYAAPPERHQTIAAIAEDGTYLTWFLENIAIRQTAEPVQPGQSLVRKISFDDILSSSPSQLKSTEPVSLRFRLVYEDVDVIYPKGGFFQPSRVGRLSLLCLVEIKSGKVTKFKTLP